MHAQFFKKLACLGVAKQEVRVACNYSSGRSCRIESRKAFVTCSAVEDHQKAAEARLASLIDTAG